MKKKMLVTTMVTLLIAIALIGTTLAYFTDTKQATNTFTVGNVKIELTEPNWVASGSVDAPAVYPGEPLKKDPTVENVGANPAFIRVKVTGLDSLAPDAGLITLRTDYVDGKLGDGWVYLNGYYYYTKPLVVKGTESDTWNVGLVYKTDALFDQIVIPTDLKNGDTETEYNVVVTAYAVQAQGARPSWTDVKAMTVAEIAAWFNTTMPVVLP